MPMRAAMPTARDAATARWRAVIAVFLMLALSAWGAVAQTTYPALTGRVNDIASLFKPDEKAALEAKLKEYEDKTSTQLVVATVPSLQGQDIADYANGLFRAWKIGQEGTNNGVLLLVAPQDKRVRIEVGYGLEGTLTDAQARAIISSVIAPRFRSGDYAAGINAGVDAITASLAGSEEWLPKQKQRPPEQDPIAWPMVLFYLMIFFFFFVLPVIRARSQGGNAHRMRNGNWVVLPAPSIGWGGGFSSGSGFGGGFSGGGGSSGGGGASGSW